MNEIYDNLKKSLDDSGKATDRLSINIVSSVGRIIESNEKLQASNNNYVWWFKLLTALLIITTLLVGVLQYIK